MHYSLVRLSIAALLAGLLSPAKLWAQTTIAISMSSAAAEPKLQGPFTVGARPAAPFLFSIPATGQKALMFSATGLPNGLTMSSTGVISGTAPAAGSYPIVVTVTNGSGTAMATYTLVSGSTIALTPPLGWNSYDSFGASVTEQDMLDEAQAVKTHLQPYGWDTVVIDYRWYEPGLPIDANGRYVPASSKYPSAMGSSGFKPLSDKIHALGLKFGIHIMRGVPRKSFDANLTIAGSTYTTKDAGNSGDPCPWDTHMWGVRGDTAAGQAWYDSLFAQYAAWGVDLIKIDDMLNNGTKTLHQAEVEAIRKAIDKSGRAIVLSLSPGPDDPAWLPSSAGVLNANANMWRVVNDFWDYNALTDLPGVFREASAWQAVATLTPGHWADLDMLPLGYLGPRNEWHTSGQTTFTKNEQVTIMTLWSILPSPLMFGGNPQRLDADPWTLALLTNEEALAINQDALGARGKRTASGSNEIWIRDLDGGRKAVAFFNRGAQDTTLSLSFSQLGVTDTPLIRDVWHRSDVMGMTKSMSVSVPGSGALLYTLSPPGAGAGGGGSGGASGVGGSRGGTGGTTSTGDAGGPAGATGTAAAGGTPGAGGARDITGGTGSVLGAGGATSGGSPGGTTGTSSGGAAGSGVNGASPGNSGCGCRIDAAVLAKGPATSRWFGIFLVPAVVLRRRRCSFSALHVARDRARAPPRAGRGCARAEQRQRGRRKRRP
jgi:alpha-galactosidase